MMDAAVWELMAAVTADFCGRSGAAYLHRVEFRRLGGVDGAERL
jgi:hypothetical protein